MLGGGSGRRGPDPGGALWVVAMSRTEQLEGAGLARVPWLGGEEDMRREAG